MNQLRKIIMNPVTGVVIMGLGAILLMGGNDLGFYLLMIGFISTI